MRVMILTAEHPNEAALCHKLKGTCQLVGIVLSRNRTRKRLSHRARLLLNQVEGRLLRSPFVATWHQLQDRYHCLYPSVPDVPTIRVHNVNDRETLQLLRQVAPHLVLVSGTNLVGQGILEWAAQEKVGIINLHTGLSPYIKGGPNCTNWCLAERDFHLIGNTVMWLNAGIDSGPIIATEQTPLRGLETLVELHWNVMEHAHDICLRAVQALSAGRVLPRIAQASIAEGRTFSSLEWNSRAMWTAWWNFKTCYRPEFFTGTEYQARSSRLMLYPLSMEARTSPSGNSHEAPQHRLAGSVERVAADSLRPDRLDTSRVP